MGVEERVPWGPWAHPHFIYKAMCTPFVLAPVQPVVSTTAWRGGCPMALPSGATRLLPAIVSSSDGATEAIL